MCTLVRVYVYARVYTCVTRMGMCLALDCTIKKYCVMISRCPSLHIRCDIVPNLIFPSACCYSIPLFAVFARNYYYYPTDMPRFV